MGWIIRKVKQIGQKYQNRYGKVLGVVLVTLFLVALPLPVPGVALGVQGLGEVLRLVGVKF